MKKIIKKIKRRHIKQIVIYGIIGVVALVAQMLVYIVLCRLGINPLYATIIGAAIGMVIAYKGHIKYTFVKTHKFSRPEFIKYIVTSLFGVGFNTGGVYLLVTVLKYHTDIGIIPMVLSPGLTFIINKFWSFK